MVDRFVFPSSSLQPCILQNFCCGTFSKLHLRVFLHSTFCKIQIKSASVCGSMIWVFILPTHHTACRRQSLTTVYGRLSALVRGCYEKLKKCAFFIWMLCPIGQDFGLEFVAPRPSIWCQGQGRTGSKCIDVDQIVYKAVAWSSCISNRSSSVSDAGVIRRVPTTGKSSKNVIVNHTFFSYAQMENKQQ